MRLMRHTLWQTLPGCTVFALSEAIGQFRVFDDVDLLVYRILLVVQWVLAICVFFGLPLVARFMASQIPPAHRHYPIFVFFQRRPPLFGSFLLLARTILLSGVESVAVVLLLARAIGPKRTEWPIESLWLVLFGAVWLAHLGVYIVYQVFYPQPKAV